MRLDPDGTGLVTFKQLNEMVREHRVDHDGRDNLEISCMMAVYAIYTVSLPQLHTSDP